MTKPFISLVRSLVGAGALLAVAGCSNTSPTVSAEPVATEKQAVQAKPGATANATTQATATPAQKSDSTQQDEHKGGHEKSACGEHQHAAADSEPNSVAASSPAEKKAYGTAISANSQMVPLAELLKNSSKYADKTVRTEGKVSAVCQGRGCWLEIADETGQAHVKLGNHKFFVPRSSAGKRAIIEGRVYPTPDKGHCEEEAAEQTGHMAKVELEATGVELFLPIEQPGRH